MKKIMSNPEAMRKYTELIDASPLFSLDREKDPEAYQQEKKKMVEYLFLYMMAIDHRKYEKYGWEIVKVAENCFKNFNPSLGSPFRHYFSRALKREKNRVEKRKADEKDFQEKHIDNSYVDDDGVLVSRIDQVDSGVDTVKVILGAEACRMALDCMEATFDGLQERQKPIVSKLLSTVVPDLLEVDGSLVKDMESKRYFDRDLFSETIRGGKRITAKEIAERVGKKESSVSRTWNNYRKKVKEGLEL